MRRPTSTWSLAGVLTGLLALVLSALVAAPAYAAPPAAGAGAGAVDLGPNVKVFNPSMPTAEIQAAADAVFAKQTEQPVW